MNILVSEKKTEKMSVLPKSGIKNFLMANLFSDEPSELELDLNALLNKCEYTKILKQGVTKSYKEEANGTNV